MLKEFKSLSSLQRAFPDEDSCINHFRSLRWPNAKEIICPKCGSVGAHYTLKDNTHKCRDCLKKFSVRNGTIFDDSKVPLRKWFMAVYLVTAHKKGISSCQLARDIDVQQRSAWFMLHRIRNATMTTEFNAPLTGTIEIDEAYVGGNPRWKHINKRKPQLVGAAAAKEKKIMFAMSQRDGELRLRHVADAKKATTQPVILANVAKGATVHTDENNTYTWMRERYAHRFVCHTIGEYVRDDVTTNRVEGAFSHFKRTVVGTYHKISDGHLDPYLQMFAFRWNRRKQGQGERMNDLLRATKGRKLTYKALTGKAKDVQQAGETTDGLQ
jgi:transposase-like protein